MELGGYVLPPKSVIWYSTHLMHCLDPALLASEGLEQQQQQQQEAVGKKQDGRGVMPAFMDWQGNLEGAFRPERWLKEETRPKAFATFGGA